jgi:hypothetical protein
MTFLNWKNWAKKDPEAGRLRGAAFINKSIPTFLI